MGKLKSELKQIHINKLSKNEKSKYQVNLLNKHIDDIQQNKNRYIFFCPDIDVVNPLIKLMYDLALETKRNGYNAVILHEKEGFIPEWLFSNKKFKEFKAIKREYVSNKVGKASKRMTTEYSFKLSDQVFIPDVYLELLLDTKNQKGFDLIQTNVILTGYSSIEVLMPGLNFSDIGVNNFLAFDDNVIADFKNLFPDIPVYKLDVPSMDVAEFEEVKNKQPMILVSGVGDSERINRVVNIFYNQNPQLAMFRFRIVGRHSLNEYFNEINNTILYVALDKKIITTSFLKTSILLGTPVMVPVKREILGDVEFVKNFCEEDDDFNIAEMIARFCTAYLVTPNEEISSEVKSMNVPSTFSIDINKVLTELKSDNLDMFEYLQEKLEEETEVGQEK